MSQTPDDFRNGPKIRFVQKVFDYDTITRDSDGVCRFEFENIGDEPLWVTSAFSTCGCTVPTWPKKPIMPGTKSFIEVKYNTSILGDFTKIIVVKTNSPDKKTILKIKGYVKN
ncbi:MAG: DUF1573 domain-containing protein [Bacteroidia bacterium]|nr:DUF1573 domain-containing protein [Bacteroidia bacterium]